MDEFDDNGWNEIWDVFGKDPKFSTYSDEAGDDKEEDQFWFEEMPDEFQFNSTWSVEETNGDGKQLISYEEIEQTDEHPVEYTIHNELVGTKYHSECQSEIYEEYDSDEASPDYDTDGQKFTGNANDEINKDQDQDDTENDPIGQKFTGDANDETNKDQDEDDTENDPIGQKFTGDANDELNKDQDQDDTENDPIGQKFTGDANDEINKNQDEDDTENDPIGQKFTGNANDEINKDQDEDDTENDPIGQKFTGDANDEINKDQDQDDTENDPIGQKFTGDANDEINKDQDEDDTENDPIGQKFTDDANDGMMRAWNQNKVEHHAGNECNSTNRVQIDKSIATSAEVETDMSMTEIVPADSCDLLPAERLKHRSYKILQCDKSADTERKTLGISRYKVLFVENLLSGTLIEKWKTNSIKISFQTAFLFAGFFSFISGTHGENVSPQDTFAAIGATVRFKCSWDLKKPVYWEWTPVNARTGVFLYIGNGGLVDSADDKITIDIDRDQGRYDLVITGVLMKHAGTYSCIENSGLGKSISAELITLDDWNCSMDMPPGGFMGENVVNIPEDSILASCSLHFSGNKDPAIRWSLSKNVSHKNATVTIKSAFTIVSAFSVRPIKDVDKSVIIAKVVQDGSGKASFTEGGQSWRSEILTVNYVHLVEGPQRVYFEDDKNVLCNPKCSFQIINAYHGAIYRHADRDYKIPLMLDTSVPKGESKWLIMLTLSIVFFAGSLGFLLFCVIYTRFKVRKDTQDGSVKTSDMQTSMESEEFIKVCIS